MPTVGNFTWDSVERPVVDGTQLEVGVGKQYATVQDAVAAANAGDTITVYTDTATQSFIMGTGNVLEVGPGQQYTKVQDAVNASSPDDIILVYEGTYTFQGNENYYGAYPDAPVLVTHDLSIIGVGDVNFKGTGWLQKGLIVTSFDPGEHLYVENVTFSDAWSYDFNGAGIRHQGGNLTVVDSTFINNEDGILSDSGSEVIHVVDSTFTGNGSTGYEHGIYAHGTRVIVENSTFTDTEVGHHIKTVTDVETIIYNNVVADGIGTASYLIDSTGGGDLLVYGNSLTKGAGAANRTFIYYDANRSYGEPGEIVVQNNTIGAGDYPDPNLLTIVVNETSSVVQFLDNTLVGLGGSHLARGLMHIEGGTSDSVTLQTKPFDDGAILHTEGADVVVLGSSPNTVHNALGGSDTIIGSSDDDLLIGGDGNDLLIGGDGRDSLLGEAGDDTIFSGSGSDMAAGGAGDDLLIAAQDGVHFFGGDDNDTLLGGQNGGVYHGEGGNDLIVTGDAGNDRIFGGDGDDTIYAGAGADITYGGDGNDILVIRGTYDDTLYTNDVGTLSWRTAAENSDADFAIVRPKPWSELSILGISDAGMVETGNGRTDNGDGSVRYDDVETLGGIEKVQFDNGVYDVATGVFTPGQQLVDLDALTANLPSNLATSETLEGTESDDTFLVSLANGYNEYNGNGGNDQILATADNVQIRLARFDVGDVETVGTGGYSGVSILADGDNSFIDFSQTTLSNISLVDGGDGNDTIIGSSGADRIVGNFGDDSLSGGAGDDTFEIGIGAGVDFIDGGTGLDEIEFAHSVAELTLSNAIISGGEFERILRTSVGEVTFNANTGGVDWDFSSLETVNVSQLNVNLSTGSDVFHAGDVATTIRGNEGADSLNGGNADDTFLVSIGDGTDTIEGGLGVDTIAASEDDVSIGLAGFSAGAVEEITAGGYSNVSIQIKSGQVADFSLTNLTGIQVIRGGDSYYGETIIGSDGADIIDGGAGSDNLHGGDGDDTFLVSLNDGTDTIVGGAGSDTIQATEDNVSIGLRSLQAGDIETISAGGFSDVSIHIGANQTADFSQTNLVGITQIVGADSYYGETIIGTGFADTIDGKGGADTLKGGAGDDTFLVGANAGSDFYDGGVGTDTIKATADDVSIGLQNFIAGAVEEITANGHSGVVVSVSSGMHVDFSQTSLNGISAILGANGSESINGSVADDVIKSSAGNDTVAGGAGNDVIDGGSGNDSLNGGDGDDTFLVGADAGRDVITGGAGNDTIEVTESNSAVTLKDFATGDVEVITANGHTGVTISGSTSTSASEWDTFDFSGTTLIGIEKIELHGGNDTLIGSADGDVIDGGSGNDSLNGGDGDDTFLVGVNAGLDEVTGGAGSDTIAASENDVAIGLKDFTAGDVEVITANGNTGVTISGSTSTSASVWDNLDFSGTTLIGIEKIELHGGNDTLIGSVGSDVIDGGSGNDSLNGGDGDDTFLVGVNAGLDVVIGGVGIDTIAATEANAVIGLGSFAFGDVEVITASGLAGVTIAGNTSSGASLWDSLDFSGTTLIGIEKIELHGGNDTLIGSAGADVIDGGAGSDNLNGGTGNDTIDGNTYNDTLTGGLGSDTFVFHSYSGTDTITDFEQGDLLDLVSTGAHFSDLTITQVGADTQITGFGGTVNLLGVDAATITDSDFIFAPVPGSALTGTSGGDNIAGSNGDDTIDGGAGNDTLNGGGGNDIFLIGLNDGRDTIIGAEGVDTISATENNVAIGLHNFAAGDVEVITANGHTDVSIVVNNQGVADFGQTQLVGITAIQGSNGYHGETIIGSAGDDVIIGYDGNDNLRGGDGNDTFIIGLNDGTDTIVGGSGQDSIVASEDNVSISLRNFAPGDVEVITADGHSGITITVANQALADFSQTQLIGITAINGTDGYHGETIIGSVGDDVINGGAGSDDLSGAAGNDLIDGGSGNDSLDGGDGNDTFLVGANAGLDTFIGGAGSDTISVVENDAVIYFGNQATGDVEVIKANGHTGVTISGNTSTSASVWDNLDFSGTTLIGIEKIELHGGNDTLIGSAGSDVIDGGAGNDSLDGGDGDDTFLVGVNAGLDVVIGGAGNDTIAASENGVAIGLKDFAASDVEVITASGHSGVTIVGNNSTSVSVWDNFDFSGTTLIGIEKIELLGGNDTLIGSAGNDVIDGGSGSDNLNGGAGDDVIDGHTYNDTLTGGLGSDTFVFHSYSGTDTVTDFEQGDLLDLVSTGVQFSDLTITQVGADTKITGYGGIVNLLGIDAATITASDFVL